MHAGGGVGTHEGAIRTRGGGGVSARKGVLRTREGRSAQCSVNLVRALRESFAGYVGASNGLLINHFYE